MGKNDGPVCMVCLLYGIRPIAYYTRYCHGCGLHLCIGHWRTAERDTSRFSSQRDKNWFQSIRCDICIIASEE